MKKVLISLGFLAALCGSPSSFAQLPVFDASEVFSAERAWLKVLDEVRVACKAKDTSSVYVWTPEEFASRKDMEAYSSDEKIIANAQLRSKCWTPERFRRYIEARIPFTRHAEWLAQERKK